MTYLISIYMKPIRVEISVFVRYPATVETCMAQPNNGQIIAFKTVSRCSHASRVFVMKMYSRDVQHMQFHNGGTEEMRSITAVAIEVMERVSERGRNIVRDASLSLSPVHFLLSQITHLLLYSFTKLCRFMRLYSSFRFIYGPQNGEQGSLR